MNNQRFTTLLTTNSDISEVCMEEILKRCTKKTVAKGSFLLMQGELCHHHFFVEKGLLRQYTIDDKGKEHIVQFAPENWFMGDRDSSYFGQPSSYFIQALEDSEVLLIEEKMIVELAQHNAAFLTFNNRLLHNHIRHLQKRITLLLSATAEERYLDFINLYPDLFLRVPQWMIASYLGIVPESLSRVRKDLAYKHREK